jgi:hypothetical protein
MGPLCLKGAVDALSGATAGDPTTAAVKAIVAFGMCGVLQHLAKEVRGRRARRQQAGAAGQLQPKVSGGVLMQQQAGPSHAGYMGTAC